MSVSIDTINLIQNLHGAEPKAVQQVLRIIELAQNSIDEANQLIPLLRDNNQELLLDIEAASDECTHQQQQFYKYIGLSVEQAAVCDLKRQGYTNKSIAEMLEVSPSTVTRTLRKKESKIYIERMNQLESKVGVRNV